MEDIQKERWDCYNEEVEMNDNIRKVLNYRYNAEIEDAKYKIKCYSEQELIIPEHPDITGEIDKLLEKIAQAEEKMAVMELHYGQKEAKNIL
jgi:hypothetical protein|tara:strand:+ start:92 stop:367 length:276 start_codon:yes stop_codon:yes gene_type:complete